MLVSARGGPNDKWANSSEATAPENTMGFRLPSVLSLASGAEYVSR